MVAKSTERARAQAQLFEVPDGLHIGLRWLFPLGTGNFKSLFLLVLPFVNIHRVHRFGNFVLPDNCRLEALPLFTFLGGDHDGPNY